MGNPAAIPLSGIAPPQQNAFDTYARLMGIKAAQQEMQTRQLQQQGLETQNEMQQLQLQSVKGLMAASKGVDWSQPDAFNTFIGNAQQHGVDPRMITPLVMERQKYLNELAQTDNATLKAHAEANNQALGYIDGMKGADPATKQLKARQALNAGVVRDPTMQQFLQATAAGDLNPTDDQIGNVTAGLLDHTTQANLIIKNRQAAAQELQAQARATQATIASQRLQAELPGGPLSPASRAAQTLPYNVEQARREAAARLPYEQQLKNTPSAQIGITPEGQVVPVRAGGAVPPGTQTTAGYAEMTRPTQQTKQMGETAATLRPHIATILQEVNDLDKKGKLGPIAGRWQDFVQGRVGTDDPDYAKLAADMALLQTGVMRAHVGARGGEMLLQHFEKFMNPGKQSAANMRAQLGAIDEWMKNYESAGHGNFPSSVPTVTQEGQQGGGKKNYWDQFPVHQ